MSILATQYPVFQQAMRIISSITNSCPATVTTTFAHQYATGQIVRLNVPRGYGMVEINQLYGPIIVTGDTTFTIDIDTTNFNVFAMPSNFPDNQQYAQVTPIGQIAQLIQYAERNVLPYSVS